MNYSFLSFPNFKHKALTLSYDDGAKHDEKLVEIFSKAGLKCTFNLCSGKLMGSNDWYLSSEEAKSLYLSEGNEIAIHGVEHINLQEVPLSVAIKEISVDRKNLEDIFGCIVRGMAYAYGSFNKEIEDAVKKIGVVYARTTISTWDFKLPDNWLELNPTCHHNDKNLEDLCDVFLKDDTQKFNINAFWKNGPKVFYMWGHSHEFERDNNWERIINFANKMGKRDDVWYATNIEIYNYVKAYNALEWSFDGKRVYNPGRDKVFLNIYGEKVELNSGETKIL